MVHVDYWNLRKSTMTHVAFKVAVKELMRRNAIYDKSDPDYLDPLNGECLISYRDAYAVIGLRAIARGGHGPTWAKTMQKMWELP